MSIISGSWSDLGYRKLGPRAGGDAAKTKYLADAISKRGVHDVHADGDDRWLRDRARRQGGRRPEMFDVVADLGANDLSDDLKLTFLERASRGPYTEMQARVVTDPAGIINLLRDDPSESPWRLMELLARAVSLSRPTDFIEVVRRHALPTFFRRYPLGRCIVIASNYEYEARFASGRALYALTNYELGDISEAEGFATLRDWETLDTVKPAHLLAALMGVAFYPHIHVVSGGPVGLTFFFVLDPPGTFTPGPFPSSWAAIPTAQADFGKQALDTVAALSPGTPQAVRAAHHQFVHARVFSGEQVGSLARWLVERINDVFFHLSDPCEFIDGDGLIDAVTAFEYGLTLKRCLRRGVSAVTENSAIGRKSAAFELAELLETLRKRWDPPAGNASFFKRLHHSIDGAALLRTCLAHAPAPFGAYWGQLVTDLYSELESSVRDSVWAKSKCHADGVMVRDKALAGETKMPWPDFASEVMRSLRNAHHGYLTSGDANRRGPTRFLSLVRGDVPDSLSHLGLLWVLGMVASPQEFLGWRWMPTGVFP